MTSPTYVRQVIAWPPGGITGAPPLDAECISAGIENGSIVLRFRTGDGDTIVATDFRGDPSPEEVDAAMGALVGKRYDEIGEAKVEWGA